MLHQYPEDPGFKRTDTSFAAADDMKSKAGTLRSQVLFTITREKLTADEIAGKLGEGILSIRPRLSELRNMGLIQDSRLRRKNESGKLAIVWEVIV